MPVRGFVRALLFFFFFFFFSFFFLYCEEVQLWRWGWFCVVVVAVVGCIAGWMVCTCLRGLEGVWVG